MAFATRSDQAIHEINVTPLIDVLLVLLIIFLLAAPTLAQQIKLDLPQPHPNPALPTEVISLRLDADGTLTWNDETLSADALAPQLRLEAARVPQRELQLEIADQTHFELAAVVLAAASNAGMQRLAFAQQPVETAQ